MIKVFILKREYNYRGIYDKDEVGRINDLLGTQRELFIEEEKKQLPTQQKVQKYFLIAMGVSLIIVLTKVLSNGKRK